MSTEDPLLRTLELNEPRRTPTMEIPLTSPAVDAADQVTALSEDQRGVLRPVGFADIGAYEAADEAPATTITLSPARRTDRTAGTATPSA